LYSSSCHSHNDQVHPFPSIQGCLQNPPTQITVIGSCVNGIMRWFNFSIFEIIAQPWGWAHLWIGRRFLNANQPHDAERTNSMLNSLKAKQSHAHQHFHCVHVSNEQ
jgi:hypothetical protein